MTLRKSFLAISFLFSTVTLVVGQTITWTGNGDGINWGDQDNWSTGFLPGVSDRVLIENDSVIIFGLGSGVEINRIELMNSILNINSPLFITSDTFGILCTDGKIHNFDAMLFDEAEIGIDLVNSQFNNQGSFKILSTENYGLRSDALSTIRNEGRMEILDSEFIGIISDGLLVNEDTIIIRDGCRFYGLQTRDSVLNATTGYIHVSDFPIGAPHGLRLDNNNARFTNDGEIVIENINYIGLQSRGKFINNHSIKISNTVNDGLEAQDTFINRSSGSMEFNSVSTNGNSSGCQLSGYFGNYGTITMDGAHRGIDNDAYLENYNSITLANIISDGFQNSDTMIVHSLGEIQGSNIGGGSAWCFNNSNNSFISIAGQVGVSGLAGGIENLGHFELTSTGSFMLSNSTGILLNNHEEATTTINGILTLGNLNCPVRLSNGL